MKNIIIRNELQKDIILNELNEFLKQINFKNFTEGNILYYESYTQYNNMYNLQIEEIGEDYIILQIVDLDYREKL